MCCVVVLLCVRCDVWCGALRGLAWPGLAWPGLARRGVARCDSVWFGVVRCGSVRFGLNRLGLACGVLCCVCCVWLVAGGLWFWLWLRFHPRANDHDKTINDNGFWTHGQTTFKPQKTTVIPQKHCQTTKNTVTAVPSFSVTGGGEVGCAICLSTTRVGIFISIDIFMTTVQVSNRTE